MQGLRLITQLRQRWHLALNLSDLFSHPPLSAMAQVATSLHTPEPDLVAVSRATPTSLSFAQQRLWFLDQFDRSSVAYHVTEGWRLTGPLDGPRPGATRRPHPRQHPAAAGRPEPG